MAVAAPLPADPLADKVSPSLNPALPAANANAPVAVVNPPASPTANSAPVENPPSSTPPPLAVLPPSLPNTSAASPTQSTPTTSGPSLLVPNAPSLNSKAYVLMDAASGGVLAQNNMNVRMSPASLTKLMTLYITFSALKAGQLHTDTLVPISTHAWKMDGSRMFVQVGSQVPVSELLQGVIVASGNDATVALAEFIGGTEDNFAGLMNQTAQALGMKNSHFMDSTGMPNADHYTTAYDMALLLRAIIQNFPEYYSLFSEKWFSYNKIKQPNRNRLLWQDPAVDGLKTGHTDDAGFCLVASAHRENMRLISVVMNAPSDSLRASDGEALLNYGFHFYKTQLVFSGLSQITKSRAWLGAHPEVPLGVLTNVYATTPIGMENQLKTVVQVLSPLKAPIIKNKPYGQVLIQLNGQTISQAPLVALEDDPKGGIIRRLMDSIRLLFKK